jgi:hypothetical protein
VIAYCYDYQWDMSPRAASRFEALGFKQVYDYVAGKADWGSFGLPLEGRRPSSTRVGAHVRTDVPACGPADRMAEVRERVRAADWDTCIVTNAERVVVGRLGRAALAGGDDVSVEEARMIPNSGAVSLLAVCPSFEREAAERAPRELNRDSTRTLSEGSQP